MNTLFATFPLMTRGCLCMPTNDCSVAFVAKVASGVVYVAHSHILDQTQAQAYKYI